MLWIILIPLTLLLALRVRKLGLLQQRVFRAVIVYFAISYVGRALYLLIVSPQPAAGSAIADARLMQPDYAGGLAAIAPEAAVGLVVLLVSFYLASRLMGVMVGDLRPAPRVSWAIACAVAIVVGWLLRSYLVATHDQASGLLGRLAVLPTACIGVAIVCLDWRSIGWLHVTIWLAVAGEAFWALQTSSKTYVLAVALFLYLDPTRPRFSWRVPLIAVTALGVAFVLIQPGKTSLPAEDYGGNAALTVPAEIVARFDLLHALTDAKSRGAGSYLSNSRFEQQLSDGWLPQSVFSTGKVASGLLWAEVMTGQATTHLATGPTAEGYAMYGWAGLIVWNLIIGLALAATARVMSGTTYFLLSLIAAAVLSSNALFETGVLGLNEALSTGVQITALALPFYLVARVVSGRESPGGNMPSAIANQPKVLATTSRVRSNDVDGRTIVALEN